MAELVQQVFETSIHDLVTLEKYGIFNSGEIKIILNKRQEFEYRLRKVKKNKNDFLLYIAYEESLLKLIRIRREKLGIEIDKYEIEQNFIDHLKKLFEFAILKFKSDISLWLSYIDFAKKQQMFDIVSLIYFRMLQVHNKPWLWIQFAKFEFEEKASSETARKIFLKCLAFHPESPQVWHEYFKFELLYCAKIRKRFKLITQFIDERTNDELTNKQSQENIWNGKLALIVYKHASINNDEFSFASKFIEICNKFDYETTKEVKKAILEDLKLRFENQEEFYNLLAINRYEEYKQILRTNPTDSNSEKLTIKRDAMKETIEIFESSCFKLNTPLMWEFYFNFRFKDLLENHDNNINDQVAEILYSLENVWIEDRITINIYEQWVKLYHKCFNENFLAMQRLQHLLLDGAERWSDNLDVHFFIACFLTKLPENQKIVQKFFDDSLLKQFIRFDQTNVDVGMNFWELYIDWSLQKKLSSHKIVKILNDLNNILNYCPRKMSEYFKSKILAINYHLFGIRKARDHYDKNKLKSPICKNFFYKMIEIENHFSQTQESPTQYCNIYEDFILQYGSSDVQIWLEYTKYAMTLGDIITVTKLYQKAIKCLRSSLCSEFVQKFALFQFSHQIKV